MLRTIELLLFLTLSTIGYSQCEKNQVIMTDSTGIELDSSKTNLIYVFNNAKDSLLLDPLFDLDFTRYVGKNPFLDDGRSTLSTDSSVKGAQTKVDSAKYCAYCIKQNIKVIDSIDLNQDGIKELFLYREWYCSAVPVLLFGPHGQGGQQQNYSVYEVWDLKSKSKIFEIQNRCEVQIATSISVVRYYGFSFDVSLDKFGSFYLSNPSEGIESNMEMGTYKYDKRTRAYKAE